MFWFISVCYRSVLVVSMTYDPLSEVSMFVPLGGFTGWIYIGERSTTLSSTSDGCLISVSGGFAAPWLKIERFVVPGLFW